MKRKALVFTRLMFDSIFSDILSDTLNKKNFKIPTYSYSMSLLTWIKPLRLTQHVPKLEISDGQSDDRNFVQLVHDFGLKWQLIGQNFELVVLALASKLGCFTRNLGSRAASLV